MMNYNRPGPAIGMVEQKQGGGEEGDGKERSGK